MLRKAAMATGAIFLVLGLAGFIPALAPDDQLIGIFRIDTVHNMVHILSGLAFLAASTRPNWSRLAFQAFGVVYALVTIIGFLIPIDGEVLGLFHVDLADNFLHLFLAVTFLYFGFVASDRHTATAKS